MLLALQKLFTPQYMVKSSHVLGELPSAKDAYKTAFSTAWPSISETFLIALMSMADTLMVSGIGPNAIAAVGLVTQPRYLALALILSLNVSVTSVCARRRGENDSEGAIRCLKHGLILSLVFSVILACIALMFSRELLIFAGAQSDTIELSKEYFDIILLGLPINALQLTISAAQRGVGNTRISMYINMLANVVDVIFNYLLIGGKLGFPKLGVRGAAIATVIGMACGLALAIFSIANPHRFLHVLTRDGWGFDRRTLSSMFKVASGSFVEQACMRVGFFTYAMVLARLGTLMFAAHQIFMNILSLSFSLGDGFGIAATSLVGQNLGAKRPDLSILYGKVCQRMSFITCILLFFVFLFAGKPMILVFSNEPAILAVGKIILVFMGLIVFAQSSQMIMMGCLRGAGDTKFTAVVSLITIVIMRPLLAILFAYRLDWGLPGAWMGFLVDQYVRLFLTMGRFSSGKWMTIKL